MSELYTFFLDYDGGTYVYQVKSSFDNVCKTWAEGLNANFLDQSKRKSLITQMKSAEPVLIDGLRNAWCVSALIEDNLALVHFVRTERY